MGSRQMGQGGWVSVLVELRFSVEVQRGGEGSAGVDSDGDEEGEVVEGSSRSRLVVRSGKVA